jgi:hypothetical protein
VAATEGPAGPTSSTHYVLRGIPGQGPAPVGANWSKAGTSRDDHRALTLGPHPEVSCRLCHRRSWNRCGSSSPPCCPPVTSTTRWAATVRGSPTGWCSTSSSRFWCLAAATATSPTPHARRPPCAAAATSGSPWVAEHLGLAVLGAYQQLFGLELEHLAVDGCITKAPAAGRSPGRARWIVASRA